MNLLLTIAARGGSKGVPDKNIRPLCGHPLIGISVLQAKRWGRARHIAVTTDSEKIAAVARSYGAEVPFLRPAEMASDTAAKVPALRHLLLEMEKLHQTRFDAVMDLDPTSPVRSNADLEACYALFERERPKSLFSVVRSAKSPYFNMVESGQGGFAKICKDAGKYTRRQDAPEVYSMNASIYVYERDYLADLSTLSAISDRSLFHEMPAEAGHDIDREIDFKFLEFLAQEGVWKLES